jgi:ribosomal protein S18 acetylase RimI-like enzyme
VKTPFVNLRDSIPADETLLFRLFAENKANEFASLSLTKEQLQPLLEMQYRARCMSYAATHPGVRQLIVEEFEIPVGQVLLGEDGSSIHIVDIAIAPTHQARGFGTAVLLAVQERASSEAKKVRLEVVPESPAARWYERLGFVVTTCGTMFNEMVWSPNRSIEVAPA